MAPIFPSVDSRVEEFVFSSFGVEKAAHGLEFAEVQSENFHWQLSLVFGDGLNVTVVDNSTRDHGPSRQILIE